VADLASCVSVHFTKRLGLGLFLRCHDTTVIPAVPRLHAVVSDGTADLGAPLVALMGRDFDRADLLARVQLAVTMEDRAA